MPIADILLKAEKTLQEYWGYSALRIEQKKILEGVLDNRDTLGILPTGGGKSITYQLPALLNEGMVLVISPLLALMKDQIQQLKKKNISAALLSSEITFEEAVNILDNCQYGKVKLLYVSPERLENTLFLERLQDLNISLIAVDEAHCISQWGHDFRPAYMKIGEFRKMCPGVPILALTATATPNVKAEILKNLECKKPWVVQGDLERKNLAYKIIRTQNYLAEIAANKVFNNQTSVVFVNRRKLTYSISQSLNAMGLKADYYHAGLDKREKNRKQKAWQNGDIPCIVATSAFGMGIDKANVRHVYHIGIPESIERYFQEAGRAGRDGKESEAILLYDENDILTLEENFKKRLLSKSRYRYIVSKLFDYFQIAENELPENFYTLIEHEFINRYEIKSGEWQSVKRFLVQKGMIYFKQKLLASQILLRKNKVKLPNKYAPMIDFIQRNCDGVYQEFQNIDEYRLALFLGINVNRCIQLLNQAQDEGYLEFKDRSKSQIAFLETRDDRRIKNTYWKDYKNLKQQEWQRIKDMGYFVQQNQRCRSQMLLAYFGNSNPTKCGKCDNCLKQLHQNKNQEIEANILAIVNQGPLDYREIIHKLEQFSSAAILQNIERLIDEGRLSRRLTQVFKV